MTITAQTIRTLTAAAGLLAAATITTPTLAATDGFIVQSAEPHEHSEEKFSWVRTVTDDDGQVYEVRLEDDEMRFFINGEEVDEDEFSQDSNIVSFGRTGNKRFFSTQSAGDDKRFPTVVQRIQPKVMLGINLDSAPESLLKHLGIDGEAIIVERVMEGLSADKAGLKVDDIIVSIDGVKGISSRKLTELLSKYKPGERAEFVVIRQGDRKKVDLEFMAYDPGKLGVTIEVAPAPPSPPSAPKIGTWTSGSGTGKMIGQHGRELRAVTSERITQALRSAGIDERRIRSISREIDDALQDMEEGLREVVETRVLPMTGLRAEEAERMAAEMRAKAEQALRHAERQMLEFRDGKLTLREEAQDLNRHFGEAREQLERRSAGIAQELEGRLSDFERRMAAMDARMEQMFDRFERFAEDVVERLEEDDKD